MKKLLILLAVIVGVPTLMIGGRILGWTGKALDVVTEEVDPRTILNRYEWFIEQWNAIQEQSATLDAFKAYKDSITSDYGALAKAPRDVRQEHSRQSAECRGILANHNRLAAEYRSAIQKVNYVPATMLPHFPPTVPTYVLK